MINGTDSILLIDFGEGFFPLACITGSSFSESSETIDTTTRDNGGWSTQEVTNQSYNISFNGVIINTLYTNGDFNKISYDRLKKIKRDRLIVDWKIQTIDLLFIEYGKGQIISLSSSNEIDEFISFEGELRGFGKPFSTTGKKFILGDGKGNVVTDGNNNKITTA